MSETPTPVQDPGLPSVTAVMLAHLRATRPWVRFVSVVGFVMVGMLIVVAILMVGLGTFRHGLGALGGAALGLLYLLIALLYVFPSLFLARYATAIRAFERARDSSSLEAALAAQKSFWRFVGILTLVVLCFYLVVLALAFAAGVLGALFHRA